MLTDIPSSLPSRRFLFAHAHSQPRVIQNIKHYLHTRFAGSAEPRGGRLPKTKSPIPKILFLVWGNRPTFLFWPIGAPNPGGFTPFWGPRNYTHPYGPNWPSDCVVKPFLPPSTYPNFFPSFDLLSCFFHQSGYKRLNYTVQRSVWAKGAPLTILKTKMKLIPLYVELLLKYVR
jgi:hypothetical protein